MIDENTCREIHKQIDYRLEVHDKRINDHSKRIDIIENGYSRLDERLSNLIAKLDSLNTTMRWFIGLLVGAFVSFFFYAVQKGLF